MKHSAVVVLAVCVLAGPGPAAAHEFWLSPSTYRATAGDTVSISAFTGEGFRGDLKPYTSNRVVRLTLRTTQTRDLAGLASDGDSAMARFVLPDAAGALVAYESSFAHIELPGPQFEAYLAEEGLDRPRAARARLRDAGPVRERYARCPRTWIAGADTRRLLEPAGLTFELVPLVDPASGDTLEVRAFFRGRPVKGVLVRAWRMPLADGARPLTGAARDSVGPADAARTDGRGVVRLAVDGPGEWLVSAVHMVRSADRRAADWESYWASLSFGRAP